MVTERVPERLPPSEYAIGGTTEPIDIGRHGCETGEVTTKRGMNRAHEPHVSGTIVDRPLASAARLPYNDGDEGGDKQRQHPSNASPLGVRHTALPSENESNATQVR